MGQRPAVAAQTRMEQRPDGDGGECDGKVRAEEQQPRRIGNQRQVEDVEQQRERQDGREHERGAMRGGEGQSEPGGVGEQRMVE